jgi:mRNA-degrading endonuclease YafQ of YafQ-DinJ toxin-antitoxin module
MANKHKINKNLQEKSNITQQINLLKILKSTEKLPSQFKNHPIK